MKFTFLNIFLLCFLGFSVDGKGQEIFNRSFDNPFLINGGAVGLTVLEINDSIFTFGVIVEDDFSTNGILLKYDGQGNLGDTIEFDADFDSLQVNLGRYGGGQLVEDESKIYLPKTIFNEAPAELRIAENYVLELNLFGQIVQEIQHNSVDSFDYTFYQVRKWGEHFYACGQVVADTAEYLEPDGAHGFLMKLDTLGNQEWVRHYGNSWKIDYMDISSEEEFVLGSADFSSGQHMVIQADDLGEEKWRLDYGGDFNQTLTPVQFNEIGNIISAGANGNMDDELYPIRLLEIEDMGNYGAIVNENIVYEQAEHFSHVFAMLQDEFYNVYSAGFVSLPQPSAPPKFNGFLLKCNANLDSLWHRTYTFYEESDRWHIIYNINHAADGGFVMTGTAEEGSNSTNVPNLNHIWTLKVDEHGCLEPGCEVVGTEEIMVGLQDAMKVFPNPVQDVLNIEWSIDPSPSATLGVRENSILHVVNALGQIVQTEHLSPNDLSTNYQINVSTLPGGHYTLHWMSGSTWYDSVKIVKE